MKYKTLLFDADGTLMDFHKGEAEAIREAMLISGIEPTDSLVRSYSEINESLWKMLERGEIEKSVLLYRRFEIFCERFGFFADPRKMADDYIKALSTKGYMFDGAAELCERLSKDFSLYIVTNGVEFIQRGRFSRLSLEKYFKNIFISDTIGYEKPSVRFFERVAESIDGFDRESSVIIGDSLTSDILGGINYGIDTCWYNPHSKPVPDGMEITYIAHSFDDIYGYITEKEQ